MKLVYSDPKTGKTAQMELNADTATAFLNHKINDVVEGAVVGLAGYKLKITGGSDKSGFPMNSRIEGAVKTRVLRKVALSGRQKGQYERATVRGRLVIQDIEQVNTVIVEYGEKPVSELFPEKAAGAKPAEEPKEAKKK